MKNMILLYGSQQAFDVIAGRATDTATVAPEYFADVRLHGVVEHELIESGEFVDAQSF